MKTFSSLTAATALLAGTTDAFWRMECHSRTGLSRMDPIVNPGTVSSHAHVFHGGNNIGMNTKYADLRASKCTSCLATDDKSAYWTPSLMFVHKNGTTQVVPQVGGMLAYYLLFANEGEKLQTFPEGFQMVAGDNRLRNFTGAVPDPEKSLWKDVDKTQLSLGQKAIGMNCLNYAKTPPEPSMYRHFLPDKAYMDANCLNGIRAELFFPSCWNGKTDSADHKSHVAYPDLVNGGKCPKGFEKRLPSLFYETIWNTYAFKGVDGTFVFANGDPTGYGYHGDFMNGWSTDILTKAISQCTDESGLLTKCPVFKLQTIDESAKCTFNEPDVLKKDACAGPGKGLCGNVQVQYGPKYASALEPGKTETATAAPSTVAESNKISAVPTLSHTFGTNKVTDSYGGGITVAAASSKASSIPKAPAVSSKASSPPKAAAVETSKVAAAASPATTQAPAAVVPQNGGKIVRTSTFTSAGVVYQVAIEEVAVTVTVPSTPTPKVRRHVHHMHHKRDREHGVLRQH